MMKASTIVLLCLTTLALLVYPLVLMGNVMALASMPDSNPPLTCYLWCSTLYPLPYLLAISGCIWSLMKKKTTQALYWQVGLICYLVLTALLLLSA